MLTKHQSELSDQDLGLGKNSSLELLLKKVEFLILSKKLNWVLKPHKTDEIIQGL